MHENQRLRIGRYLTRDGRVADITSIDNGGKYPVYGTVGNIHRSWTSTGEHSTATLLNALDLVATAVPFDRIKTLGQYFTRAGLVADIQNAWKHGEYRVFGTVEGERFERSWTEAGVHDVDDPQAPADLVAIVVPFDEMEDLKPIAEGASIITDAEIKLHAPHILKALALYGCEIALEDNVTNALTHCKLHNCIIDCTQEQAKHILDTCTLEGDTSLTIIR